MNDLKEENNSGKETIASKMLAPQEERLKKKECEHLARYSFKKGRFFC
jgi:hypothetical protein